MFVLLPTESGTNHAGASLWQEMRRDTHVAKARRILLVFVASCRHREIHASYFD